MLAHIDPIDYSILLNNNVVSDGDMVSSARAVSLSVKSVPVKCAHLFRTSRISLTHERAVFGRRYLNRFCQWLIIKLRQLETSSAS